MKKKVIHTKKAPAAIGTYSQAIESNGMLFISGQIPLVPTSMEIIEGDFEARARQVFTNLQAIAEAAGGDLNDAIKITVFLTDLKDFSKVNSVMEEFFVPPYAARAAVGVSSLPRDVDIEADAILAV